MPKGIKYSEETIAAWPDEHKKCNSCNQVKPLASFTKDKKLLFGVSSICRTCANATDRGWTNFTKEEIDSWGSGNKKCKTCKLIKSFSEFHKTKQQLFGLNGECKDCRKEKSKLNWEKTKYNIKKNMVQRARHRAKNSGVPFDIDENDIFIPDMCPVFKTRFILGDKDWTYSLDKIVPSLGYVKGNVIVVSNKANVIKNNATADEVLLVGNFYKNLSA